MSRFLRKRVPLAAAFALFLILAFTTHSRAAGDACQEAAANKKLVLDFYTALFEKHQVKEAFDKFVSPDYIQHNPNIPNGTEPDIVFLTEKFKNNPESTNEVKRALAEGDLVVLHVHSRLNPADRGRAIVDIFRIKGGKIVEHWDVIQPVPEQTVSGNPMF